ncbi:MAG: LamG domain-containing protein [Patescibacteria group bacterium]
MVGSESATTPTLDAGSTVIYYGDGDDVADEFLIKDWDYSNLTVDMADTEDSVIPTAPSVPDDTYRYWKFDDGTGITATDSSGNGKSGTTQNMEEADWDSSIKASTTYTNTYSLNFGGTDEQVIAMDATSPTVYTMCAWVRPNDVTSTSIILRSNGDPGSTYMDQLQITSGSRFQYYSWDGGAITVTGTTPVQADTWYHVCATAQNGGQAMLYVNGIEEGTPDSVGTLYVGLDRWHIGSYSGGGYGFYVGYIDDIRVYDRILSSTEITTLANVTSSVIEITVLGNLNIFQGTLSAPATLNVAGDWSNTDTFTHNSGTVNLNGTLQTITGDTTFYNLTKETNTTDTLTFTVGDRQTIEGTMTLKGAASNLLSLRSSSEDSVAEIDPQGTRDIRYLDVQDSHNVNATDIVTMGLNITNGGNNPGWNFLSLEEITKSVKSSGGVKYNNIRFDP